MGGLVRRLFARRPLPGDLSVGAVDGQNLVAVSDARVDAAAWLMRLSGRHAGRDGGQQEQFVAPDDRGLLSRVQGSRSST